MTLVRRLLLPSAAVFAGAVFVQGGCRISYEIIDDDGVVAGDGDVSGDGDGDVSGDGDTSGDGDGDGDVGLGGMGGVPSGDGDGDSGGSGGTGAVAGTGATTGTGGDGTGGNLPLVDLLVDVLDDENDPDATPSAPGGSGFSLREAISYANRETSAAHHITFSVTGDIPLSGEGLPPIQGSLHIEGSGFQPRIDGSGIGNSDPCFTVESSDVTVEGLEVFDCPMQPFVTSASSGPNVVLANNFIHDNGEAVFLYGDAPVMFFNFITASAGAAIVLHGDEGEILANLLVANAGPGVVLDGGVDGALVLANIAEDNSQGIYVVDGSNADIWHNTVRTTLLAGALFDTASGVDFRNNILASTGTHGVEGSTAQFSALDYNLYWDISGDDCSACTIGPNSPAPASDPLFSNPAAFDYKPLPGSGAIDLGVDVGSDRNLDLDGLFNGAAPDIGAIEADP